MNGEAQGINSSSPKSAVVHTETSLPPLSALHFESPITFPLGSKQSGIIADFKCDMDGSIYFPMINDLAPSASQNGAHAIMIVALNSSGSVVRFIPEEIPGYRNAVSLLRYFVSKSYVYVLAMADKIDPMDSQKVVGRFRLIEVFNHQGELTKSIVLDPEIKPINLAAFESGEILVFSLDQLNHTARLFLLDAAGRLESELKPFDDDFVTKLDLAAKAQSDLSVPHDNEALFQLLGLASLAPYGENLMLAASKVNLPVLELNQHGVVHSMTLALPPGTTIHALLPSDDGLLHAVVGDLRSISSSPGEVQQGFLQTEIDEFYPQDGSLFRRVSLEAGPKPVCAMKGNYTFLAPREADGRFQLIRATPVSK